MPRGSTNHYLNDFLLPRGRYRCEALWGMVSRYWFVRMRWVIVAAAMAVILLEERWNGQFERPSALFFLIVALAALNLAWTLLTRFSLARPTPAQSQGAHPGAPVEDSEDTQDPVLLRRSVMIMNAQIATDLLVLTMVIRHSGGVENPMAVFYLFHMAIGALVLTSWNAFVQGCWALLLYGALIAGEYTWVLAPHYPFIAATSALTLHQSLGYCLAAFGVVCVGVFGTLYFSLQIAARLDGQEQKLRDTNHALVRSQTALRDLEARRARFMQTAAHQLKSPVTGIKTLAGLIVDDVVPPDAVKGTVGKITRRCGEALEQISELLTLARVQDADPWRHQRAKTDAAETARQACAAHKLQASDKRQQFEWVLPDRPAWVRVDERDLRDCYGNLIENAIKYTPEGGHIRVELFQDLDTVTFRVKDNGIGIAEEAHDDIFDAFRRGNLALANKIPGSGLGLSIVREVVEQAGGRVTVASKPGEGSEFTVVFRATVDSAVGDSIRDTRNSTSITERAATASSPREALSDAR